jgi:hypothetical protein
MDPKLICTVFILSLTYQELPPKQILIVFREICTFSLHFTIGLLSLLRTNNINLIPHAVIKLLAEVMRITESILKYSRR